MKIKGLFVFVLIIILVSLAGCNQNLGFKTGNLTVLFSESGIENITPSAADTTYELIGTHSEDTTKTFRKAGITTTTVMIEDLLVGTWNIEAKAYNATGTLIYQSSSIPAMITEDRTATVTLPFSYLTDGKGSLSYSLSWSKNIDKIKGFRIEIEGRDSIFLSISDATLTGNTYKLTGSQDDIPAGKHDVVVKALDNNNEVIGTNIEYELDIYKNLTFVYDVTLNEGLYPPNTPSCTTISDEHGMTVSISTRTPEAEIYYTTDGSDPSTSTTRSLYNTPFTVNQTAIIKTVAMLGENLSSDMASAICQIPRSDNYQLLKKDMKKIGINDVIYLNNPTIVESFAVSWKVNGETKTEDITLDKGYNLITAILESNDGDLFINFIFIVENSEQVTLSKELNVGTKTGIEMVTVLSGKTTIKGDNNSYIFIADRDVTLSPYEMGKFEVTQELFNQIMSFNPSWFQGEEYLPSRFETQKLRPIEQVTWYDAIAFCNKLTELTMTSDDCVYEITNIDKANPNNPNSISSATVIQDIQKKGFRLPTEAEWEYAARGGDPSQTAWDFNYSGSNKLWDVGWDRDMSDRKTREVGKLIANSLGIFDMTGNVWEWCWDLYGDIQSGEEENPVGANIGTERIIRGSSYTTQSHGNNTTKLKVNYRYKIPSYSWFSEIGFRICRTL